MRHCKSYRTYRQRQHRCVPTESGRRKQPTPPIYPAKCEAEAACIVQRPPTYPPLRLSRSPPLTTWGTLSTDNPYFRLARSHRRLQTPRKASTESWALRAAIPPRPSRPGPLRSEARQKRAGPLRQQGLASGPRESERYFDSTFSRHGSTWIEALPVGPQLHPSE